MVVFAVGECKRLRARTGAGGRVRETLDAHDARHARNNLGDDGRGHRFRVWARVPIHAQTVDERFVPGDVPARGAEAFREGAHEDIDPTGVDTEEVRDTAAVGAQRTDRVSFVNEQVELPRDQ